MGLVMVLYEYYRTTFIRELKKNNFEIWESLGRPAGYFMSGLLKNDGFGLEIFIYKKKYSELGKTLSHTGKILFYIQLVYFFTVAVFLMSILYSGITFKPT